MLVVCVVAVEHTFVDVVAIDFVLAVLVY